MRPFVINLSFISIFIFLVRLLNRALDPKLIKTQDISTVLSAVASNSDGLQIVWEFYKENYQKLIGKLSTIQLGVVLNSLCNQFANTSRKQEVWLSSA